MKKENRLNKRALARKISEHGDMTITVAENCLDSLIEVFRQTMQDDGEIVLKHMGTFSSTLRGPRLRYIPGADQKIMVPAKRNVRFTPSCTLFTDCPPICADEEEENEEDNAKR